MIQFIAFLIMLQSGVLYFFNRRMQPSALYLALSLAITGIMFVSQTILLYGGSAFWLALLFNHFAPFYYLLGPLLYFYVRATLTDLNTIRRSDAWHFLPCLVSLIGIAPYVVLPWSVKLEVATLILEDLHNLPRFSNLTLYPAEINRILRPISWVSYSIYCLVWVIRFARHYPNRDRIPESDARPVIRFIFIFLLASLITAVIYTSVSILLSSDAPVSRIRVVSSPLMTVLLLGLLSLTMTLMINPSVLYGIPRISSRRSSEREHPVDPANPSEPQSEDVKLGEPVVAAPQDRFAELAAAIPEVMEEHELYLDPDFSLEDLARSLDVPKHHIYYCFNSVLKTRFTRMRSEFRVKHVQRLIREGATKEKTLDAIGLESGFSSSTTFRAVFKEVTGQSPSEYISSLRQD